jgi:hypothetical protein
MLLAMSGGRPAPAETSGGTSATGSLAGPIDGSVAGDVFRFRNTRGNAEGELTVSGDEMTGSMVTPGLGGSRPIFSPTSRSVLPPGLAAPLSQLPRTPAVAGLALKNRLPSMSPTKEYVDVGGLMSYGPSLPAMFRQAATYVDKILLSGAFTAAHRHSPNVTIIRSSRVGPAGARLAPVSDRSWEIMGESVA